MNQLYRGYFTVNLPRDKFFVNEHCSVGLLLAGEIPFWPIFDKILLIDIENMIEHMVI